MTPFWCRWCPILVALSAAAQEPKTPPQLPAGVTWEQVDAPPPWVAEPPTAMARFRFVTAQQSNLQPIATDNALACGERDCTQILVEQFAPAVGIEAARQLAATAWQEQKICRAAVCFQGNVGRGPGNSLATAWLLWEIPVRATVDVLDPALRGRAERTLLRPPLPWNKVPEAPDWVAKPPRRDGWFAWVLHHDAEWPDAARELATAKARDEVGTAIVQRLSSLLGDEVARRAADSGLEDLQPVARALWFRKLEPPVGKQRYATTAWVHWEVPVARIVEAVPQDHRAGVARLLTEPT